MSDALLRHNWHLLVSPYWSPLYPFLVGVGTWLARPSFNSEYPVVHVVNLLIFVGFLASFEFLLRQVISLSRENYRKQADAAPIPACVLQVIGYSLFAWTGIVLIGVRLMTPDLLVALFICLDAGLLLQLRATPHRWLTSALLGVALCLGYFAKTVMFPLAFVFMAVELLVTFRKRAQFQVVITLLVFAVLASPLVVGISRMVGSTSFGEDGTLNYAWYIDAKGNQPVQIPFYSPRPAAYLEHPPKLIYSNPNVFAFSRPFKVTYSPWFDPPFWNEGVTPRVDFMGQLRAINRGVIKSYKPLVLPAWGVIGGFVILWLAGDDHPLQLRESSGVWCFLIPGISGFGLYLLVHVATRLVAPFVLLIWLGLFSGIRLGAFWQARRISAAVALVVGVSLTTLTATYVLRQMSTPESSLQNDYGQAAVSLRKEGLLSGDTVAILGSWKDGNAMYWARLDGLRIVAQIPSEDASAFWRSTPSTKRQIFEQISRMGVRAMVTEQRPPCGNSETWHKLGSTHYYAYLLPGDRAASVTGTGIARKPTP